jgi:hypothetical protein
MRARLDATDVLAAVGAALCAFGLGLIYPPLAPIFVGGLLLALGVLGSTRRRAG